MSSIYLGNSYWTATFYASTMETISANPCEIWDFYSCDNLRSSLYATNV